MFQTTYTSPMGKLYLAEADGAITYLKFSPLPAGNECLTPLLQEASTQLDAYFAKKLKTFDLPLAPMGTDFQKKVWQALCTIPYGEICSYKDIAEQVGSPRGFRAVGLANNRNPISIFIPCHRVLGISGKLVGYGGGLEKKEFLLKLEEKPL